VVEAAGKGEQEADRVLRQLLVVAAAHVGDDDVASNERVVEPVAAETGAGGADPAQFPGPGEDFLLRAKGLRPSRTYPVTLRTSRRRAATSPAIASATAESRKIALDGGAYVAESSYFQANWQRPYWGPSYARLRDSKARYGPEGLFFFRHGVGSEGWSEDGFDRLG
jgi:hypothetical protein